MSEDKNGLQAAMRAVELAEETALPPLRMVITLQPGTEKYANDIRRFVDAMIYKLDRHKGKGRWEDMSVDQAMALLAGEYRELHEAVQRGNTIETILEAADVANYALIIASIIMDSGK